MFAKGRDRWDEALRDLRRAHHLNPNNVDALSRLGWAEMAAGDLECGLDYLHQALRTNPRDPVQHGTYLRLAQAYFLSCDYERATEYALLAIAEAPDFAGGYMFLAAAQVGLGNHEKAASDLERARRIAPDFIESRLNGTMPFRKSEHLNRFTTFLRVAARLESPSAADCLR